MSLWRRLLPVFLGVAVFVLMTGGNMLAPGNVSWLQHQDLAQSYLGWAFYRHGPWGWPLGAHPSYGLEFHSSVFYSDSIPLMAMALKPFSPWLPEPFQYFGLWVLMCFVLQAVFAWRLLSLATPGAVARTLGCVFFLLAPPLLFRLGGHMALFAHWPILAALLLYLEPLPRRQDVAWTCLVAASMVIHAYIFVMVAAVWAADLLRRAWTVRDDRSVAAWLPLMQEVAQVVAVTVAVAWLAGFFMVPGGGMGASGFGFYKMNLLAPVNGGGWSWFGLQTPQALGEYEGFNYLGVGAVLLCLAAAAAQLAGALKKNDSGLTVWPLLLAALGLTLLALTPHLGIGAWQGTLPLPGALERKLSHSSIQSTGRLFWVAYYALLVWAFFALARALPSRAFITVLVVLVSLQLLDLGPGLVRWRQQIVQRTQADEASALRGPFWDAAGERYKRLRLVPTRVLAPNWEVLARYALKHRMPTDAVQVARANWKVFNRVHDEQLKRLAEGRPEEDTLYVLDADSVEVATRAARAQDAVFQLDGWTVLAPGWGVDVPAEAMDLKSGL
ncbi:DUF6311 domain-containing protein [Dyella sp. C11]|uniref:DUF6311 domain-containing protein n=1 Tax=Dyella sp. C11 TaxID=2126991 RepID=UPI000D64D182|nr:DUF6311 domain-containing protein [Dyella sp. C11]